MIFSDSYLFYICLPFEGFYQHFSHQFLYLFSIYFCTKILEKFKYYSLFFLPVPLKTSEINKYPNKFSSFNFLFLQNKYFLVRDINTTMDRLATLSQFQAPNVRRCRGNYPVYGMGQPTKDGLTSIIQGLKEEGHQVKSIMLKLEMIACLTVSRWPLF